MLPPPPCFFTLVDGFEEEAFPHAPTHLHQCRTGAGVLHDTFLADDVPRGSDDDVDACGGGRKYRFFFCSILFSPPSCIISSKSRSRAKKIINIVYLNEILMDFCFVPFNGSRSRRSPFSEDCIQRKLDARTRAPISTRCSP